MIPTTSSVLPEVGAGPNSWYTPWMEDNANNSYQNLSSFLNAYHSNFSEAHGKSGRSSGLSSLMLLRFWNDSVVGFTIAMLGIVGNMLALFVLCRQRPRLTTNILLQGLAITDIGVLFAAILLRSLRYIPIFSPGTLKGYLAVYPEIFVTMYPLVYWLRLTGLWLTVLLTADRWVAVCKPLHALRLCTVTRAYRNSALVGILALIVCLPRAFEYTFSNNIYGFEHTWLLENSAYTIGYRIITFSLLQYILPIALLAGFNYKLIVGLRQAVRSRRSLHGATYNQKREKVSKAEETPLSIVHASNGLQTLTPLSKDDDVMPRLSHTPQHRSVTVTVVVVVIVCFVCNLAAMASHTLWSLHECFPSLSFLEGPRRYMSNVSNLLVTINAATNFLIYCLCSRNFRLHLCQLVTRNRNKTPGMGRKSSSSSLTRNSVMSSNNSVYNKLSLETLGSSQIIAPLRVPRSNMS